MRFLRFWKARNVRREAELMSLDMLLLDSMATLMQASVNVSRLATYMPYLQAGSMYSITSFDSVFDFGLIRGLLSRSRFGFMFVAMHAVTGSYARPNFVDYLLEI